MTTGAELLAAAKAVLLDFDGPVTPLMPPPANMAAAEDSRAALVAAGVELPASIAATTDHMAVLRWASKHAPRVLADVEAACTDAEVECAKTSTPTPGARELLLALHVSGTPVVIVSNNAVDAIRAYLERHGLQDLVRGVIGRPAGRPDLMKPDPYIVHRGLDLVGASPTNAVLIGDSVSDVEVARRVGVPVIGFAKTPRHVDVLSAAGAPAIVENMASLLA